VVVVVALGTIANLDKTVGLAAAVVVVLEQTLHLPAQQHKDQAVVVLDMDIQEELE